MEKEGRGGGGEARVHRKKMRRRKSRGGWKMKKKDKEHVCESWKKGMKNKETRRGMENRRKKSR